jgi:uncharacterized protein YjiK
MVSKKYIREVRTFENLFENNGLRDNITGLAYQPNIDRLLSLQDPAASATTADLNAVTLRANRDTGRSNRIQATGSDPLNTAFDSKFNRLLSLKNGNQLIEIKTKADGSLDPATLTRTNIGRQFGLRNPQGISVDSATGALFVLNRTARGSEIVRIQPGADGSFAEATVSRFDVAATIANPRGLALDPTTGSLQLLSQSQNQLYELSQTGEILATRDLAGVGLKNPQALVFAPSGDQTDNPNAVSLYVADNAVGSGGITELSLVAPSVATLSVPNFVPNLVRIVQTSQFSPASPDPDGITYISQTNSLLISDSEVDEIPSLFPSLATGKNLFNVSLSGVLQSTLTTTAVSSSNPAFTKEPTGVSYNPANKALFISDDDKFKIITVNPGADGQYYTADDSASFFLVTSFGGIDAEDVAYSPSTGNLFVMDGTNAEVYQVTTSGTLVSQFDTLASGITDPEGIAVGDNGNLFVVGNPGTSTNAVGEFTSSGTLVRTIDISAANPVKPAGIAFAPSSGNSAQRSLYIVDRGVDNNDDPNENDGRLYEFSLGGTAPTAGALAFSAPTFSVNENGTPIAAIQVTRTGGSAGAVSATVSLTNGTATAPGDYNNSPLVVNFANGDTATKTVTIPIVDDSSPEGNETVNLSLGSPTNGATIGSQNSAVLTINDNDVAAGSTLYVSPLGSGTVAGISFADEDILTFNQSTGVWSTYFDGSDVGLSGINLQDFHLNADGSLLMAVSNPITLPGAGLVDDSDIIRFAPTSTGTNTAGTFSLYFDGSDVGLETDSEEIDGLAIAPNGKIIISTNGSPVVPGVSGADEDLLAFTPTGLGSDTTGTWEMYFDGSDVGLSTTSTEDVDGVWLDSAGKLFLTTVGAFDVTGAAGDGSDIITFTPSSLGSNTSGTYAPFFDGSNAGLTVAIDGIMQTF